MLSGRWTCRRCYAANNPGDETCTSCGWPRVPGTTPPPEAGQPEGGQPTLAQPPVAARPRPWWHNLARFAWVLIPIGLLGFGLLSQARRGESGEIVGAGTVSVTELAAGDCFNAPDDDEVSDVEGRPCNETHEFEVFAIVTYPGGGEYPGEDAIADHAGTQCVDEFEDYVGVPYMRSELDFSLWLPTREGWEAGDRQTICAAFDPADEETEGSVRDSER